MSRRHRGVGAAFRRWQDYRELRRFLRRVMNRAVMGKDARAKQDEGPGADDFTEPTRPGDGRCSARPAPESELAACDSLIEEYERTGQHEKAAELRDGVAQARAIGDRDVGAFIDARKVAFAWRHGDCLLIENATAMHARATFTGPRRILACMAGNLDDA